MRFLLTFLALLAPTHLATETDIAATTSCCVKVQSEKALSDNSLYQLDSTWTNDAAQAVRLVSLQGRPQVVTMFFSTCAFACPILINDMKRIETALPEHLRTNIGFVLISFDTDRDTPAALAAFRARHSLPSNWILLRGGSDDVLEIAALLGIKYKKDPRGDFAHSNVISLLENNGEIVLQQIGLNRDPQPIRSAVENILKTETPREGNPASALTLENSDH